MKLHILKRVHAVTDFLSGGVVIIAGIGMGALLLQTIASVYSEAAASLNLALYGTEPFGGLVTDVILILGLSLFALSIAEHSVSRHIARKAGSNHKPSAEGR